MQILGYAVPSLQSVLGSLNLLQLGFIGMVVIILLLFSIRMTFALHGTRYTFSRVAFVPIVYTLFTIYLFYQSVGMNISVLGTDYVLHSYVLLIPAGLIVGFAAGFKGGRSVKFYEKKSSIHFRKSVWISLFWTLTFVLEFASLIYFPTLNITLLFTGLLSLATGMLDGQAIRAHFMFKANKKKITTT
ncbi:hypothetical protein Thermo_01763 [Thermoplasmatales archaeon]|nr:hypothetical protein Thermo_01763 [Thermoplasmatales archaeon]